ncbi:MAG: response regulator [Chloroflexi bacterium]|nr:response regulator [Chloroflexota bacterium]MCC6893254.1 response regulator [Anaerolineae bacterium]
MLKQQAHILIIEDDPAVARGIQDGLQRETYRVEWKANGRDGVDYAQRQKPHLVILDVRLPDGTGFDFCRQMRQLGLRQPIIILTVNQDETDKVLGLEMGTDVALTGYDDTPVAERVALTSVSQPIALIASKIIDLLLAESNHQRLPDSQIVLEPSLVVRKR